MRQLLRKLKIANKESLIRILAFGTAGSGFMYFNRNTDSNATASMSVSPTFRDLLLSQWPLMVPSCSSQYGNLQLYLSRSGTIPPEDATGRADDGSRTIATAAAIVIPALVHISVPCKVDGKPSGSSSGSGTIIDSNGTILTCAHCVVDSRGRRVTSNGKVDVTLQDGRTYIGTVVNADLHTDIAIVKITSSTPLPTAKLGSSTKLRPGDWVVAMGCPHSLKKTITAGIVSCIDRKSNEMGIGGMLREYIQTDCATNPGNSGGPLVNLDGEVIGVNVKRHSTATGLSFAVPIDSVSKILQHFKENGRYIRPWLGVKMLDLNRAIVSQLKDKDPMFPDVSEGVLILMVTPGSPADVAGFYPGDVIVKFQGQPVKSIAEIIELMEDKVGIPMVVIVQRSNDTLETSTVVVPEETNPEL